MTSSTQTVDFTKLPSKTADFTEQWTYLKAGVDHTMNMRELSVTAVMNLYTTVYNYCTYSETISKSSVERTHRACSDLYDKLCKYLCDHLKPTLEKAATLSGVDLLRYYAAEWDRYTTGANGIKVIFAYLDRYWVKKEKIGGKRTVFPVYTLAMMQWREKLARLIQLDNAKLTNAIIQMITDERNNGKIVEAGLVKSVIASYISVGIDDHPEEESLDFYKSEFEGPFIRATEEHFNKESEVFLSDNSVPDYLKKVEEWLHDEDNRVRRYLHPWTTDECVDICKNMLIKNQGETLGKSFRTLLEERNDDVLQRMYALVSCIPDALTILTSTFEVHVRSSVDTAKNAIKQGENNDLDPTFYDDVLRDVRQNNLEIIDKNFKGDDEFMSIVNRVCQTAHPNDAQTVPPDSSVNPDPPKLGVTRKVKRKKKGKGVERVVVHSECPFCRCT